MAKAKIGVELSPVDTRKIDASLARIQSRAKNLDFSGGAQSINKLSRPLGKITGQATDSVHRERPGARRHRGGRRREVAASLPCRHYKRNETQNVK